MDDCPKIIRYSEKKNINLNLFQKTYSTENVRDMGITFKGVNLGRFDATESQ